MITRILFVCLGNICRSPAAEAICRVRIPGIAVDSAGTSDWHVGDPPYSPMQLAAHRRGIEMSDLRARRLLSDDFERFDLILGMDSDNMREIETMRPAGNTTPARRMTDYAGSGEKEVPDPYYTRDFEHTLDLLERCIKALDASLRQQLRPLP